MPFGRASIFLREGENVQDEQQDILYRAAEVWKELTEYHYVFTYGYKGELHEIKLTFSPEDFPHLAGFHYLKDIALPRYSPRKTVDMILSGKITYDKVKKGTLYQEYVKPRLLALVRLKEILEQEFDLFSYLSMICQDSGRHSRQAQRNRMETDGHIGGWTDAKKRAHQGDCTPSNDRGWKAGTGRTGCRCPRRVCDPYYQQVGLPAQAETGTFAGCD